MDPKMERFVIHYAPQHDSAKPYEVRFELDCVIGGEIHKAGASDRLIARCHSLAEVGIVLESFDTGRAYPKGMNKNEGVTDG